MEKVSLFIIDPQFDFCDPTGNLFVKGADADMERLGKFIKTNAHRIADIQITLDSHHYIDIAHPVSWVDKNNKHPAPFTIISVDDVKNGVYRAYYFGHQAIFEEYVSKLAANGRYPLCIWPVHCLIGSIGATIVKPVFEGMITFENQYRCAGKTSKGSNIHTEHYSAVKAEVEDPKDPFTKINTPLIETLNKYDKILISGEALSHCVANTIRDVADIFSDADVKKFVLLEDTVSNVDGFKHFGDAFIQDMINKGMEVSNTQSYKFN